MDNQKVDIFMMTNAKMFPTEKCLYIREQLLNLPEEKWNIISFLEFKDPIIVFIISVLIGSFGIDRFYLNDVGMGILKLFTGGVCGILTIYDWITIMNKTKELNFEKLLTLM